MAPHFTASEAISYPHLLLLHSITKRYAIPGVRLGYLTGCKGLLDRIRTNRMPWSVNQLAIQAGLYLLQHPAEASINLTTYLKETNRLRERLLALGAMDVWETETHFMIVRLRFGKASALKAYLAEEHGLLIRDASNFEGLDERFFRIATQTPEENDRLVEVIKVFGFIRVYGEPCIYEKVSGSCIALLILYVDDILLIGNE